MVFECWHFLDFNALPYKALLQYLLKAYVNYSFHSYFSITFFIKKFEEISKTSEELSKLINDFVLNVWKFLNVDSLKDFFLCFNAEIIPKQE